MLSFKPRTKGWGAYLTQQSLMWHDFSQNPSVSSCYRVWLSYTALYLELSNPRRGLGCSSPRFSFLCNPDTNCPLLDLWPPGYYTWFPSLPFLFPSFSLNMAQLNVLMFTLKFPRNPCLWLHFYNELSPLPHLGVIMPFFFYFFLFRWIIHLFNFSFVSVLFFFLHSEN